VNEIEAGLNSFVDSLLELTSFFILPDWNDVIQHMLPAAVVLFLLGPIITLLVLYWLYQWLHMPRFRVRPAEVGPVPVPRDEAGEPRIPASVPYCSRDGLLYPVRETTCSECRQELTVRCPVDGTLRSASEQTCTACGTRYVLGASDSAIAVQRRSGPPAGGEAAA
jgi:hypothetical protein